MRERMFNLWVKAQIAKQDIAEKMKKSFTSEDGGADGIIIAVIIIIIVVALGIAFREQIGNMVDNLFGKANEEINSIGVVTEKG